ncbi:hypothetical protein Zmor_020000 [Zophobas morio]|uniref:Uncharacterized protein n=1 Tax=Zophobas morio TaxID=2755281 RepID=A0AA38I6X4_9CUCU|nr:hypothetical protein Zmor_020000 [Zophobas morio]
MGPRTSSLHLLVLLKPQEYFTLCMHPPGKYYDFLQLNENKPLFRMVLDILSNHSPQYITLNNLEGFLTQQWFLNADGRITNSAGTGRTLDVHKGVFVPGGLLKIYPENDTPAQYFFIEEKV